MAVYLGIDIGPALTTAALVDEHGQLTVLALGDGRTATASAVVAAADGSLTVGDAATTRAEDSGSELRSDPMGTAGPFDEEAVRAIIAHVLGRATTATGMAPDVVGVVHPDQWGPADRDRLIALAESAGAGSALAVSARVALRHRAEDVDQAATLATGAAVATAAHAGPIVTREDIGGEPTLGALPIVPVTPSVSVFDETDDLDAVDAAEELAGPAAEPAPSADSTTTMPAVPPAAAPRRMESRARQPVLVMGAVALVTVAVLVVLFLLARDGSGDGATETVPSSTVTTSTVATTTAPSTTASTSTTSTTSTSSTTTSTSTSTTTTSSTTTVPLPVGDPGPVTLVETGLVLDTGMVLRLGADGDDVLEALQQVLGDADSDTGFSEVDPCFSPRTRFVRWGQLEIVISADEDDSGAGNGNGDGGNGNSGEGNGDGDGGDEEPVVTTFTQWYVDGADDPPGLVTIDGLGVGATVGFLEVNYGGVLELGPAFEGSDIGVFAITNPGSGGTLLGLTEALEPESQVTEMWAGDECTRVFT